MTTRTCAPRCAIDLEEDVHVPGQYESQPDGWNVTSLQIKPAYDREISPYADCDGGRTPRAKVVTLQETEEEAEPAAATVEDQPAGWFETSLQIEEKYPAHVTKIRGEDVRRSNNAVYNDEGEDEVSPDLDQPDGWNVTSLQLDPDRQAAIKIQAMRRGSKGRSDAEAKQAENQATSPLRQRIGSAAGAAAGGLVRGLSSLSSALIGASVEDAKEDMTPEQAAAVKAAAERGRRRSVGEEERVVGEDDAAEEARQTALEAARQSAAKRTAEQTAEATAAQLTSDGMEYDRLIHAHRSSIAREEGELARAVAAEVTEEVAREEAHAAAKRRASVREEEEVRPAHLARVLRLRSTGGGGGEPLPLCSRTTRPPHYAYHAGEAPAGGRRGSSLSPPSRGVHCRPSARQHLTLAPTPRPNASPP